MTIIKPGRKPDVYAVHPDAVMVGTCPKCGCEFIVGPPRKGDRILRMQPDRVCDFGVPYVACPTEGCEGKPDVFPIEQITRQAVAA